MNLTQQHYDEHLAAYYSWSVGGAQAAIARAAAELAALGLPVHGGVKVLDLGAGFGAHAVAVARRGGSVVAVDSSRDLLGELGDLAGDLPIQIVVGDMVDFVERSTDSFELVLCMGDTLTHLPSIDHARRLVLASAGRLKAAGSLVVTLRDYSEADEGSEFHVVVRSEPERIATCVVEHRDGRVFVRDLLHELVDASWRVRTSRYVKLRLAPGQVSRWLEEAGLAVRTTSSPSQMVALLATRRTNEPGREAP